MKKLVVLETGKTKKGLKIILCQNSVWILSENYNLGRIIKNWKYVVENVRPEEARKAFNRRKV